MLALFAGSYSKEDFDYLIAVLAEFERDNPCLNSCEVCKHSALAQMCNVY
nr:MAG TPA: hypothetical protein [Caudoviricetes sp.]